MHGEERAPCARVLFGDVALVLLGAAIGRGHSVHLPQRRPLAQRRPPLDTWRLTYCAVKHMAAAIVKDINLYPGFVQGELIKTASGPNYDNERAKGRAATWCGRAARS